MIGTEVEGGVHAVLRKDYEIAFDLCIIFEAFNFLNIKFQGVATMQDK